MANRFEEVRVGDQLEMPASRGGIIYGASEDYDPDRVVRVSVVTDIWFDPVENREFIALAHLRNDGTHGRPTEKRTIRGLAQCGYRPAARDWIAFLTEKAKATESGDVIQMFRRR